ncbi:MAG: DegT/DnrJ/EryC1/StrS family aminotransferase [Lentisphaerae bacterium]|nr:DegT/DnrJ/EryC1/StrS family aminotransferase [Lentisphaerota bacterium]
MPDGASKLALLGGPKAVTRPERDMFTWPIVTKEDEQAVLKVLRERIMSGIEETKAFEREYAAWQGVKHALGFSTGTASLHAAMFGCKVGVGDEIICPSLTFWASCLQAFSLGATIVFAEVDPLTLCLDPNDIEKRITPRTKAIMVVHYCGYPADMDPIMAIARKHNIKVIEDVSHVHGALYKGRRTGAIGDVAGYSMMSGKSLAIGEAGMLTTNDTEIFERALAFGHYERYKAEDILTEALKPFAGLPLGGYKYRMHQMSAAVGRVQLKYYDARMAEIQKAMNLFWDLLEGVPGIQAHRPPKDSGSTMGGWYAARGLYQPEALEGLSLARFAEAVRAEGAICQPGCNTPLHTHPLLNTCDVYGHGKPTRLANADRDLRQGPGSLPVTERVVGRVYGIPWFKHYRPNYIRQQANAYKKVARHYRELLPGDTAKSAEGISYHLSQWSR